VELGECGLQLGEIKVIGVVVREQAVLDQLQDRG
jgi:hypothetical protein